MTGGRYRAFTETRRKDVMNICTMSMFARVRTKEIMIPEFYHEVAELEGIELIQGTKFIGKPHYDRKEQIMCLVDGKVDIALVPHVNR